MIKIIDDMMLSEADRSKFSLTHNIRQKHSNISYLYILYNNFLLLLFDLRRGRQSSRGCPVARRCWSQPRCPSTHRRAALCCRSDLHIPRLSAVQPVYQSTLRSEPDMAVQLCPRSQAEWDASRQPSAVMTMSAPTSAPVVQPYLMIMSLCCLSQQNPIKS